MRPLVQFKKSCQTCSEKAVKCNCCRRTRPPHLVENRIRRSCKNKQHRVEQIGLGVAVCTYTTSVSSSDLLVVLTNAREITREELINRLAEHTGVKWYLSITVGMMKINREGEEVYMETTFREVMETLLIIYEFDEQFNNHIDLTMRRIKQFISNGSG